MLGSDLSREFQIPTGLAWNKDIVLLVGATRSTLLQLRWAHLVARGNDVKYIAFVLVSDHACQCQCGMEHDAVRGARPVKSQLATTTLPHAYLDRLRGARSGCGTVPGPCAGRRAPHGRTLSVGGGPRIMLRWSVDAAPSVGHPSQRCAASSMAQRIPRHK